MKHITIVVGTLLLATAGRVPADQIANFPFNSGSATSTESVANVTVSDFMVSSALTNSAGTVRAAISSSTLTAYIYDDATEDSLAGAIAGEDYFSFSVTEPLLNGKLAI